ncbi:MAG: peptide/nickel transport system substrate-binding protein [Solirubrobacteraceae bacterium]|jgi:peptide/nickel transport system substrate-binding protein|nr:peptide/nickel transport system substrate-binding protein [Solirubrobacteraceae bacterium]
MTDVDTDVVAQEREDRLARSYLNGRIDRRTLLRRGAAMGAGVASTGLLGSLLAACGGTSSSDVGSSSGTAASPASGTKGGTLKAALTGEPDSLDPAKSQIYTGAQVYDNVFSKLVDIDEKQQFYGVLATKWTQTDPKTWVFELRDGVKFHNGDAFSADDVKYTFERILDKKTASGYASLYEVIDRITVDSPTKVTFHLKTPFGPFLANLANNGEIVNKRSIEAKGSARKPVGTGPFAFVEWVQGDHLTLKRFDGYFDQGKPSLDGVTFRFANVDQGRIDALRSGDLDWVDAVPLQQVAALKKDPTFTYVGSAIAGIPDFLTLNTKKPPFDNKALRQAVALVVDRQEISSVAYFGTGDAGGEEVPSSSKWFSGTTPYKTADVEAAKAKMKEAGLSGGLTVTYLGLPQYPELLKTGQVVREQLKKIGITMKIQQVDVSVWFDRFSKGDFQITSAYQERTIDPDNFYSLVLKSGGPINTSGYASKQADDLIDRAARETDEAKRKALYEQLRQVVWADSPLVFTHYETLNYLMRKQVTGSTITPTLELRLGNVSMGSS